MLLEVMKGLAVHAFGFCRELGRKHRILHCREFLQILVKICQKTICYVEGERFEPIPANKQEQKAVRNRTGKVSSPTSSSTSDQRSSLKSDQRLEQQKSGSVPSEPGPDEERIALAVKLPNGNRVQRYFSPFDSLKVVLQFVETSENSDYSGCEFMCHETKNILNDFRKTIRELNLADKTVLYIQLPAE